MKDLIAKLRRPYKIPFHDTILEAADAIEGLEKKITQRGARMQIMREIIYQSLAHDESPSNEEMEQVNSWFDDDGVPK